MSEPWCVLKYDIEVSGFGSQRLGHVCLLNLKDQSYPGSDGTKDWPTWTTPVLRWAKKQGAFTGYAHSASGLAISPADAARRLLAELDSDKDGRLSRDEAARGLLPEAFDAIDADRDGFLSDVGADRQSRPRGGSASQPGDPGDERRRRPGNLRDGHGGPVRLHQRHGHGPHPGVELLVSHPELRLPAEGQRRDRFPVHERHAGSARGGSTSSWARSTRSISPPGARGWPGAVPTSRTATLMPWSSPSTVRLPARSWRWKNRGT